MSPAPQLSTELATHDLHHIWVRGVDLTESAMGHYTFSEMTFLLLTGRRPNAAELALVDAVLVALVEHGLTPSAVIARVTYGLVPDSLQAAVSAGLLGVGGRVLGSMEACARLLEQIDATVAAGEPRADAIAHAVDAHRRTGSRLPGLGHAIHTEGDPRAARLFALSREHGQDDRHRAILTDLATAARPHRPLPVNVTGAAAAVLLGLGIPWQLQRGFALIARTVGLVAHIGEELERPITPAFLATIRNGHPGGQE